MQEGGWQVEMCGLCFSSGYFLNVHERHLIVSGQQHTEYYYPHTTAFARMQA